MREGDGERGVGGEDLSCPEEEEGGGRCELIWVRDCVLLYG
jgi:hypothetical protein